MSPSKRRSCTSLEPLSPRERGRGEGTGEAQTPGKPEPSSGPSGHLLTRKGTPQGSPEGEGKSTAVKLRHSREGGNPSDLNHAKNGPEVALSDRSVFQTLNGLWKGKKEPFVRAIVVRNTNFTADGILDLSNVAELDVEAKQLTSRTLQNGDIIVERSGGGPKQAVGRVCYFDAAGELPYSFSNFTSVIRVVDQHRLLPRYVHYYLLHLYRDGYMESLQHATTGIRNLDFSSYLEAVVPEKSMPEQQKIAAMLWKMQRAIATQDRLIAATRDLKQSAMQRLFTHGLRGEPLKDTAIGPLPENWSISPLSQVARLERGRFTYRPRNEPRFYGGSTPFVQTGDVVRSQGQITKFTQSLNEEGVAISRVFPAGTILITIAANIGFVGVLTFDSACPDSLVGITPNKAMDTQYLAYYLQRQQPEMDRQAPKGTQKNINIQFLQPWPVVIPGLDEQQAIAAALATIDRKLAHHQRKRAALNDLFQSTLHQLMTAQIRVANLDIDTSEITPPQGETA